MFGAFAVKVAALNSGSFAGYSDWRTQSYKEFTIVNLQNVNPSVSPAFNNARAAGCDETLLKRKNAPGGISVDTGLPRCGRFSALRLPMGVAMRRALVHVLAAVLVAATPALGADQLLLGKKLLIKNPPAGAASNKVVHLAKDASIALGAAGSTGDPQCAGAGGGGGSLHIVASGGAGDVTISLPCAGWTTNRANSLYRYKDASGATCKLVLVKAGVLAKAVCKGSQLAIEWPVHVRGRDERDSRHLRQSHHRVLAP